MNEYEKTGYLNSNFKIFHLVDKGMTPIGFHFHDFHKILLLMKGNVSYCVEGRTYDLQADDIVFVPAGEVHRPVLHDTAIYERIIIYISKDYLNTYRTDNYDLAQCLIEAHQKQSHVLRVPAFGTTKLGQIVRELEQSLDSNEYANELYHNLLFLEFMIQLNRVAIHDGIEYLSNSSSNKKMIDVIDYLNEHLTDDLSIDFLAETFYLSRYHLMHAFKEETGYTIGNYLSTKRLLLARDRIRQGEPITNVCYECGFRNYSTFSRAYKKNFGCSPREQLSRQTTPPAE
ncbi:MAG: AraC family transcriptional regulator [Lachnobacterium sp.]|nr:AraC family transcriptional regulator [Lachnobacterium sp.]MDD7713591.1 AraC family transcriptional regulator [Lachnobacterium sp.]MDY5461389.1 AraC family transcriptional regulator [Agathobacter sp.]